MVFRCSEFRWCCNRGGNGTSCCGNSAATTFDLLKPAQVVNATNLVDGLTIARIEDLAAATNGTQPGEPVQTTGSQSSSSNQSTTGDDNHKLVAVGVGVGIGVGVPLLAALIGALVLLRKEKNANSSMRSMPQGYRSEKSYNPDAHQQHNGQPLLEGNGFSQPKELDNTSRVQELGTGRIEGTG